MKQVPSSTVRVFLLIWLFILLIYSNIMYVCMYVCMLSRLGGQVTIFYEVSYETLEMVWVNT